MGRKIKDITGMKFGKLTAIERTERKNGSSYYYKCKCECGNSTTVDSGNLNSGHTKSCARCNTYMEKDGYMVCRVADGREFRFDREDYEIVSKYTWCINHGYVATTINNKGVQLHRLLINPPPAYLVDHINHDKLDNRKSNLRIVTNQQNMMNRYKHKDGTSIYKGVYWNKQNKKWKAQIRHNRKNIHLGYYIYEVEAAEAYNKKATELFGEYALLNIIKNNF